MGPTGLTRKRSPKELLGPGSFLLTRRDSGYTSAQSHKREALAPFPTMPNSKSPPERAGEREERGGFTEKDLDVDSPPPTEEEMAQMRPAEEVLPELVEGHRRGKQAKHRISVLPESCPPIALNRIQAAEYVGVSHTKFDQLVADGRMPKPHRIDGRVNWDREELREAYKALPRDGEEQHG